MERTSLLDVVRTNQTVLRGYPDNAFTGRSFVHANVEYRFALVHPQRGWRTFPLFVCHLHAAVFLDAAHAWNGSFALIDVKTGDRVRIDLNKRTADILISKAELAKRRKAWKKPALESQTPWQELQRSTVGQLQTGACLDFAVKYQRISQTKGLPRDNH